LSAKGRAATLATLATAILSLATLATAILSLAAGTAAAAGSAPTISDLPSIVRQGSGATDLAVVFPHSPDANTLRAAITAASAFSGLSTHGVTVGASIDPTRAQILASPVSVIEMDPRPGAARLSLKDLAHGNLLLTVAGEGQGLINAAKLLSTKWIAALGTSTATLPASLTAAVAKRDTSVQGTEGLGAGSVSGNGALTITRHVSIPVDEVITKGNALFRMGVEYNAPGGGRLTFRLNGWTLGSAHARGAGNTFDYRERIASVWTDGPNLQPGYYLNPGENTLTITATPSNARLAKRVGAQLALTTHSNLEMTLTQRRPTVQLALWPFPLYHGNWNHTTVVMPSPLKLSRASLSTLITALADTEHLTGAAADPLVTFQRPTAAERAGNLLVFGNPETVAGITASSPLVPGLIIEQRLAGGGYALLATDTRAMAAFAGEYAPGEITGKTVIIDSSDHAHTIVGASPPSVFRTPEIPWLKPAGAIAALILAWVAFRVLLARRRLRQRSPLPPGVIS
jgi:hypothetical protein